MNIILVGAPASGKGTLANQLNNKYALSSTSTGDLLREEIEKKTEIGQEIESLLSKGHFAPNEITNAIMDNYIKANSKTDLLLDGYPRNEIQADALDSSLRILGKQVDLVLVIEVDKSVAVKRILNRFMCPECKRIGTVNDGGVCPACGANQIKRDDDTEEIAAERFRIYKEVTKPVIQHYENVENCKIAYIDGNGKAEDTLAQVEVVLDGKLKPRP